MTQHIRQDEFYGAIACGDRALVEEVLRAQPFVLQQGMEISAGMRLAGGGLRMPLHQAALFGQTEIARLFVAAGAGLEDADKQLCTPLLVAVQGGHTELALLLLEAGADPNAKAGIDDTALMYAAGSKNYALAEKLAAAGADLNAIAGNGSTALHWAAEKKDRQMIALLIRLGIDARLENFAGFTAAGQDANMKAYIDGCCERRAEELAFIENQIDMVKNGSGAAVAVRKPFKFKPPS